MAETTIREIEGEEMLDVMYRMTSYAFRPTPPLPDREEHYEALRQRTGATYFALFEDGQAVACSAATDMTQNVRGEYFSMGGIWGVATQPAARRKGYSYRVLTRLLASLRESGKSLSCLYPFRESFYERLGYAAFPHPRKATFELSALQPLLKWQLNGTVEQHLIADASDDYLSFLESIRRHTHGMAMFDHPDLNAMKRNNHWLSLAKADDKVVGLMRYDLQGERTTRFTLRALRFYYQTPLGRYLLLDWLARHIDHARQAEVWLATNELPETWLPDLQVSTEHYFLAPMGRVLDISKINGLPVGAGSIKINLIDPVCPWNTGVWRLQSEDGCLSISPANQADCTLTIQGLSALIFGSHDPVDFTFRKWGSPDLQQQQILRSMFPPRLPYLHEFF